MKCEKCHINDATVKLVRIINNKKTELYLCKECAQKENALSFSKQNLSVSDFLASFMNINPQHKMSNTKANEKTCSKCGMSWREFKKSGRLGCSKCYQEFKNNLIPMIRQVHGDIEHQGYGPRIEGLQKQQEVETLKRELQMAIGKEEYEQAAELRDKIKMLEGED